MKRILCLMLCLLLCSGLLGCNTKTEPTIQVPAEFFYLRADFSYKDTETIIASELRESAGHEEDLVYLMNLYLAGPESSALSQPFPQGCSILSYALKNNGISLVISDEFAYLNGMDLTTACVCLAKTLTGLTAIDTVILQTQTQLLDGQKTITIQDGVPVLTDDYISPIQYE